MAARMQPLLIVAIAVTLIAVAASNPTSADGERHDRDTTTDSYVTPFEDSDNADDPAWSRPDDDPPMPGTEEEELARIEDATDEYFVDGSELLDLPLAPPEEDH